MCERPRRGLRGRKWRRNKGGEIEAEEETWSSVAEKKERGRGGEEDRHHEEMKTPKRVRRRGSFSY